MKKNTFKLHNAGWKRRISLVLIFTMLFSTFMHQGWYNPKQAQAAITTVAAFTNINNTATAPASLTYTMTAGTNRMLVVAVARDNTTASLTTLSLSYGGQALTKVVHDEASSSQAHSWLFYLQEAGIAAATNSTLTFTWGGAGTVRMTQVDAGVFGNVDQSASPISNFQNYNSLAATTSAPTFATALNCGTGDQAVGILVSDRTASTTSRTLTADVDWTIVTVTNVTLASTEAMRSAVLTRNAVTAGSEATLGTFSGTSLASMSAMSIKMLVDLTVGNGTDPASGNAPQGQAGLAMDAFTLGMRTGTATVNTLTLTGGAQFLSSNVSAIKIYRDNGTVGTLDGADVLVATTTAWASNVATITFTSAESVTTTTVNYLVVIDVTSGAAVGSSLTGTITGATGTGLGVINILDTSSAGLTVTRSGLGVGDGFNPANANTPQASLQNAMNAFTLDMGIGSGTVNTLTLTGSANFTTANVASVKVYREKGGLGILDGTDVLVPTTYSAITGNATTITFTTPEPVTTTKNNYLVAIDVAPAATLASTLTGTITAAAGTGIGTPTYSDSGSGTLTVTAGGALTIGDGQTLGAANAPITSQDNVLDSFTTVLSAGNGQLTALTLTGTNLTTANIANIKIFADSAPLGTLNGSDKLIPTTYTHAGTTATITFTNPEPVSTTVRNYLVVVDIKPGATVGQTITGYIATPATGTGYLGTPTFSDAGTPQLTIAKAAAVNSSCTGCHGYSSAAVTGVFYDGVSRNTPTGAFVGSHETHVGQYGKTCSTCHVAPATETSADFNHRTGNIQMATNINGDVGGAYGKGTSWTQTNSPTAMKDCTNVYCHSQGTGATGQAGDTRTISAPATTLAWGQTSACDSCHGFPPNYANGTASWGTPTKANSHGVHTTVCQTCHSATTSDGSTITGPANHANKQYNIASGNSVTIGSYAYAAAGGTCSNISCHGGDATILPNVNNAQWGTSLDCTTCHNKVVYAPRASLASGGTVTNRRAVATEFNNTWSHKRSAGGAVTKYDCCVCHMEGDSSTGQADLAYHGDGYIELRDPDTGSQILGVTFTESNGTWGQTTPHNGAGSYASTTTPLKFVEFSRNLGVALEADTSANYAGGPLNYQVVTAIEINQCLKCHDSNGAASPSSRVPGGTALQPFATAITGHTAPFNSNGQGNVVDVNGSFATTNATYHPVRGRQNNSYTQGTTLMIAPLQMTKTNGNNTQYGYLISCWDCHAPSGASGVQTSTVTAHGAAATLRGSVRIAGTTGTTNLCINCHATLYSSTSGQHGTGSAFAVGNSNMNATTFQSCAYCHAYTPAGQNTWATTTNRPIRGEDAHGFNDRTAGTVGSVWTSGSKPYGFIRNMLMDWRPAAATGLTTQTNGNCTDTGATGTPCSGNMGTNATFTPGGTY